MEFDLEKYKFFVKSQVVGKAIYNKIDVTEQLLEALFQFREAPSYYLKNLSDPATISKKYKRMLKPYVDKPVSVWLNDWFLYNFGYKHCSSCDDIKSILKYSSQKDKWNNLCNNCSECDSNRTSKYYINNLNDSLETKKKYRLDNLDKYAAYTAKYKAAKIKATPKWLTTEQYKEILAFYIEARYLEKETGVKYHVDHIIPLQGKTVCGLHVPWNLQILTSTANLNKSNKVTTT